MPRNKATISKAGSYYEIAQFWDTHDLADYWDKTRPVEFEIDIQSEGTYYPVETALSKKIRSAARKRGVSAETLLNLWVKENLEEKRSRPFLTPDS
ncbi:MAG TPA: CopG family antitoxin [Blastocatellia bacterium]|nr:CopG family antitoxin [Blastocatellia bacterium]